jgi:hypothetical protein
MTTGVSLFLIAVGAILKYAITAHVEGVNLHTAGLVLLVVGAVGLVISVTFMARGGHPEARPPEVP